MILDKIQVKRQRKCRIKINEPRATLPAAEAEGHAEKPSL